MKDFLGSIQINSLFIDGGAEMKNQEENSSVSLSACYMRCCLIYESFNKANYIFKKKDCWVSKRELELESSKTRLRDSRRLVFPLSHIDRFLFCFSLASRRWVCPANVTKCTKQNEAQVSFCPFHKQLSFVSEANILEMSVVLPVQKNLKQAHWTELPFLRWKEFCLCNTFILWEIPVCGNTESEQ